MKCIICHDSGWVCENHEDTPSGVVTDGGCGCGGAAVPCACNPDADCEMEAVIATVDPSSITEWVQ